ncbi:MAG: hypothetical protein WCJ14_12420, partial [Verrucomicrobiota bacterium]
MLLLLETTQAVEVEAAHCRSAESELQRLRLVCAGATGSLLAGGLLAAFLVLVFADFLQSFFDTACNSAAIREIIEQPRDS